ncbi:MAG: oligosaccharide flippase family protein [Candidatus Micrarchaeia archaeon]
MGAKTAHVATFIMLGQLLSTLFAGIAFIVIARILGPGTYGIYTLAMAVSGFFGSVGDFGVGTAFNKFIAQYKAKGNYAAISTILADGFLTVIIVGALLATITFILSGYLAKAIMHNESYYYIIYVVSLIVFFSLIFTPAYYALVGFGKGAYVAVVISMQTIVQATVGIALAISGFGALAPIIGIILGFITGIIIALYFIYARLGVKLALPKIRRIRKLLNFSLPLALSNVLGAVANNFSLMFLGAYVVASIVGYIGIATRTVSLLGILTGSISLSILPMFSSTLTMRIRRHIGKLYNYSVYVAFLLIVPAILFIVFLAKPFTVTVFSGTYANAAIFVAIIAFGNLIGLIGTYSSMLLASMNKVKKILEYSAIIVAVEFALMPLFIIFFKGIGFVFLFYILAPIISTMLYIHAIYSQLKFGIAWKRIGLVIVAGILSSMLLLPLIFIFGKAYIPLLVAALIEQLLSYPAIISLIGATKKRDLINISEISKGIPVLGKIMVLMTRYSMLFAR